MVIGRTMKHDGNHHGDFLAAAGFQQLPLAERPNVGGLSPQHIGQRRAAFDGDGHAVEESGQRLEPGAVPQVGERGEERSAGAGFGEHAGQLVDQRAVGEPGDPVDRAHRALAGGHGQRQHLGDHRELGDDLGVALVDRLGSATSPGPARRPAAQATISSTRISGFDCPSSTARTADAGADRGADRAPQHLLDAELVDGHAANPRPASRRSTEARPPSTLSMNRTASRTSGAVSRPNAVAVPPRDRAGQQPGRPGGVGEVRRDPIRHGRPAQRRRGEDREQQPGRGQPAEQAADQRQVHRSTRRSSGSRPIRIISR